MTFEATLVNKKLLRLFSSSQSWAQHSLNVKGCPTPDEMVLPAVVKQQEKVKTTVVSLPFEVVVTNRPPQPLDPSITYFYPTVGIPTFQFTEDTDCQFAKYDDNSDDPHRVVDDGAYIVCKNYFEES